MIDLVKLKLELSTENPEVTNDPLGKLAEIVQKVTINRGLDEAELSSTTQQEDVNTEEIKNVVVGTLPFLLVLLGLVVFAILSI